MGKKLKWIMAALLLVVFCGSGGAVFMSQQKYAKSRRVYEQAAAKFTIGVSQNENSSGGQPKEKGEALFTPVQEDTPPALFKEEDPPSPIKEDTPLAPFEEEDPLSPVRGDTPLAPVQEDTPLTPFTVDFDLLQEVNPEVVGWIYCEGTKINYPVCQGTDNQYYLHYNYEKLEDNFGAIFADAQSAPDFADSNTVLYGHNMHDGSMFAGLELWRDQGYYEEHPVMWLLTPETDYKVILFSGHTVSAYDDIYTIFREPMPELTAYLEQNLAKSDFNADMGELDPDAHYIVLSTCAYDFATARYVVHGKLEPVGEHGWGW